MGPSRVILVGGAGFIGRRVAARLAAAGVPATIFDRVQPRAIPGVRAVVGDLQDADALRSVLAPDAAVVHMAWTTIPATSNADPGADAEDNVLGSIRLWEACAARRVGRVIFLSSGGTVYGNAQRIPIREDDPTEPICAYGVSKLAAEKYLGLFHGLHGLDHVVLRPGNAYGPGQDPGRGQSAATVVAYRPSGTSRSPSGATAVRRGISCTWRTWRMPSSGPSRMTRAQTDRASSTWGPAGARL